MIAVCRTHHSYIYVAMSSLCGLYIQYNVYYFILCDLLYCPVISNLFVLVWAIRLITCCWWREHTAGIHVINYVIAWCKLPIQRFAGCSPVWDMATNTNAEGGILQNDVAGFQACQDRCVSFAWCTAIDWAPTNTLYSQCYLHQFGATTGPRFGVTHYELRQRCPSGSL